jgi:hypothetical protein
MAVMTYISEKFDKGANIANEVLQMTEKIRAIVNTVGKKEPIDSTQLPLDKKTSFLAGWVCDIESYKEAENQHWEVQLGHSAGKWFFYKPHVNIYDPDDPPNSLVDKVVACCETRGYRLARGEGEINIIGIEGMDLDGTFNPDTRDKWNDLVGILRFHKGQPRFDALYRATTEPSQYWTNDPPGSLDAVARLDTGFHSKLWQVGRHRGYEALVQADNTVRLVRDRNRNHRRDDIVSHEQGNGINLHTTKTTGWTGSATEASIGPWSAGCVVIYNPSDFLELMSYVTQSKQHQQNRYHDFDFILLWSRWLKEGTPRTDGVSATEEDLDVMARTIWGEARGESFNGKVGVAWVIRNRMAKSPKYNWPATLKGVCHQMYQFSCWNPGDANLYKLKTVTEADSNFRECKEIARKVVKGELADVSNGADHYYANYIAKPNWATGTPVAVIGVHLFYKLV